MAAKTTCNGSKYEHLLTDDEQDSDVPDTFRAYDTFPAGRQCGTNVADMPDDEDSFGWTAHYEESRQRTNPDVTDEVIETLLTDAICREAPGEWDNRYLVQTEIDGYEWTMVVADDGTAPDERENHDRWVLITIYSNYHGSIGTTNKYFDRLRERRGDDV